MFSVVRPEKYGGVVHYKTYEEIEQDFKEEKIHPGDLKGAIRDAIIKLLAPIQELYAQNTEWQEVTALAYPDPNAKKEVKKKVCFFFPSQIHSNSWRNTDRLSTLNYYFA